MYSFTRNCPAPRLKKWSYMDSTWCVSTWCQPALGAWNQSCFLPSSFLAKSIIRAITGSQKAVCEASVRSQPDVLKKEHVSFVRRNELRFSCLREQPPGRWVRSCLGKSISRLCHTLVWSDTGMSKVHPQGEVTDTPPALLRGFPLNQTDLTC